MQRKEMKIRGIGVFSVIVIALALLCLRIYYIGNDSKYIYAAETQRSYKAILKTTVGTVYDRDSVPITDESGNAIAAIHTVGYINGNEKTGLRKSYDSILQKYSGQITQTYIADAVGRQLKGDETKLEDTTSVSVGGIVTTLQLGLQLSVEEAMNSISGAAVVMTVDGDIAAICSSPTYSAESLAEALNREDSPMLNRALQGYNVGSVFKICVSAAAMESGADTFVYDCTGSIDVYGQQIGCHKNDGHGLMNIQTALVNSCNPYFIALGQNIGSSKILQMAQKMSFGERIVLADGISSTSGILPDISELKVPAALANLSIGQGTLLASPLQVAVAVNCVAAGGIRVSPRIVMGETADGKRLLEKYSKEAGDRAFGIDTANMLKCNMEKVFSDGTLHKYAPEKYTAAAKTSTAQTGILGKDGETICQTWLAGFYPSQNPKYTIVVLVEDGQSGTASAGPIFKKITDYIGENCI